MHLHCVFELPELKHIATSPVSQTPPSWQPTAYSQTAHEVLILKQVSYLLYKALQGMVNFLQDLIFNTLSYKASIYNEHNAYRPFALARFNGKVLQDINAKLSFLGSMRY